ncbi:peptidase C15, pyroglutamyl peptidase I-like protein [Basidiobolus meristosporus CBS 931.73]|uniref:Peptidase C15, pyroglutamyl peptidase I-like protein n=1 Tax=Basidiobolus meristosporus CBS 931.73 TaxID=1314790 RepID=A0A1Y1YMK6_9FUNG|nr:peptidase C15, pyroglutamyl peptidase I-like protein [Basidiobolus meristosporus CBS 931.73]|eukprot:ORX98976.1 peptidase C15, pyroglutamyl peptidase I-like protein [Basidiobolus meristosporus CBS 931.73]
MKRKHVLLTGFQPFGEPLPEVNPSWECIKALDEVVLEASNSTEAQLGICELPVEYGPVLDIIPTLHSPDKPYTYYIHIGQGRPGSIRVETLAHQTGYKRLDNAKCAPSEGKCPRYNHDALTTLVNVEKLVEELSSETGYEISSSNNAGRYLCEYTYYCSMAESIVSTESHEQPQKRVLFVHVPPIGSPYELSELTSVIKKIVIHVISND